MKKNTIKVTDAREFAWSEELNVNARNRDSRMFEESSELREGEVVVVYDWTADDFDENEVANDLAEVIENETWNGEDYTLYNDRNQLVGFAYNAE